MIKTQAGQTLIFVLIVAITMLITGSLWGVVETSEARFAEISREMFRSGDWIHPRLLNIYHYHKPPVTYWVTASAYNLFGVNAFAARFFLVIAFCIQALLIFRIALYLFNDQKAACYSVLVYTTLPIVLVSVRGLTTDAYLNTFILLSIYGWLTFINTRRYIYLYTMAAALALGFMTKGPVILIFPLLVIGSLWSLYDVPPIRFSHAAISIAIFTTIGLSWFAFLIWEDARFADYFFFHHFVDRIVHAEVFSRKQPWYYYLLLVPPVTLPWIVPYMVASWRNDTAGRGDKITRNILFGWLLLPLILFSFFSSKLILYVLPLSIGLSLATGFFLTRRRHPNRLSLYLSGFACLLYVGLATIPLHSPQFYMHGPLLLIPVIALLLTVALWALPLTRQRTIVLSPMIYTLTLIDNCLFTLQK